MWYHLKMNKVISKEPENNNCIFLSTDLEKTKNIKILLIKNKYEFKEIIENNSETGEIEYSIIVNSEKYDEICDYIEEGINIINGNNNEIKENRFPFLGISINEFKKPYYILINVFLLLFLLVFTIVIIVASN